MHARTRREQQLESQRTVSSVKVEDPLYLPSGCLFPLGQAERMTRSLIGGACQEHSFSKEAAQVLLYSHVNCMFAGHCCAAEHRLHAEVKVRGLALKTLTYQGCSVVQVPCLPIA